jgi:hypothetical protein
MPDLQRAARDIVDRFIAGLEGDARRVADAEWGFSVDAAGWPLHVGVALRDGLLRAQAEVVAAGRLDPHTLLHWNRGLPLARFTHTGAGDVWVQADLPLEAVSAERLDGFLGLLVRVATQAREAAGAGPRRGARAAEGSGRGRTAHSRWWARRPRRRRTRRAPARSART